MTDRAILLQLAVAVAGLAAVLAAWAWFAAGLPTYVLPGPGQVLAATLRVFTDPALLAHVGVSLARVCLSVLVGMALALALAALARVPVFEAIVEQRVFVFFSSFPAVGWAVLGVIWFQVSTFTVIFVQVAIILPFCLANTLTGFRQIDPDLAELGRSLTRHPLRRFVKVTLPLILPFLVAGLRVAYGLCWKIALVAELFGAPSGLGFLLMRAQQVADAPMVFGLCLAIVLVYGITDLLVIRPLAARAVIGRR